MQKGPPPSLCESPLASWFTSSSDGRWPTPKSLYALWFHKESCQVRGLSHQGLAWLNRFPPEPRTRPIHMGWEPKPFAKEGARSCAFRGADTHFSRGGGNAERPSVARIQKGLFRPKTLITSDSVGILLMAAILLMSRRYPQWHQQQGRAAKWPTFVGRTYWPEGDCSGPASTEASDFPKSP